MFRFAIAFGLALAATSGNAQDNASGSSSSALPFTRWNETRPFLFDGRMKGDGQPRGARADNRHPTASAIVVQPRADQHAPPGTNP